MAWMNNDGLYLKFGTEKAVPNKTGEFKTFGALREVEIKINPMTALTTGAAIISDVVFFPAGVRIEEVELVTDTVVTGASSTLSVGLVRLDRSTEIDFQAFLKNIALTSMDAAGEKTVYRIGVSGVGDLVGTTTTLPGYITADWDTAAFTAGAITIRIRYYTPTP